MTSQIETIDLILLSESTTSALPIAPLRMGPQTVRYDAIKRVMDVVVVMTAIILLLPMLVFIAVFTLTLQGRPILIKHPRVGRNGRPFRCLKFRSMVSGADEALARHLAADPCARAEWDATQKLKNDPRVTPLGAVLRKSSIDELPQLWNVLVGDMSLVGPRPIVEREVSFYGSVIAKYFTVRPGLTGPWQISGRSDVGYAARVSLDENYVDNRCFQSDLLILVRTVPAVLRMRGSY